MIRIPGITGITGRILIRILILFLLFLFISLSLWALLLLLPLRYNALVSFVAVCLGGF